MTPLNVDTAEGLKKEYVYSVGERPYEDLRYSDVAIKSNYKTRVKYLNFPVAFDIETTTIRNAERPYAFMYHWQMCIDKYVFFGRTWYEWLSFLEQLRYDLYLSDVRKLVIYVHNLPYEFQFFRRFVYCKNVFCRGNRNVLRADINECFEFRCSYALSNKSLSNFISETPNAIYLKNDGERYNYGKIRTPMTKLNRKEKSYCYCDVRGLCEALSYRMKSDDLAHIPLTSTGYVRRDFRNEYRKDKRNREHFLLRKLNSETYTACTKAFRGGDTHANLYYVDEHLHNITSYDISSSYPAAMLYDKYPVGAFIKISPKSYAGRDLSKYAQLIHIRFTDIKYKGDTGMPYIPLAKCEGVIKPKNDNGRILEAETIQMWLTDIDLDIIEECYTYRKKYIECVYISRYGFLPIEHKNKILEYFKKKTALKNISGHEYEYHKSKNLLNSSYGMMVTDIAKDRYIYDGNVFKRDPVVKEKALNKFYKSRNNFLSYQWGVWVTANARRRLRNVIDKLGRDLVYVDTDSVKFRGNHNEIFEEANADIIKEAERNGYYADDSKGVRHYIGAWEFDGFYTDFKTLGSKRYLVVENGETKTTIAGVSKKAGAEFFKERGFDKFENGCKIKNAGHVVAWYNDDPIHNININGVDIVTASNIALADETYTLGLTGEYLDLIEKAKKKKANII